MRKRLLSGLIITALIFTLILPMQASADENLEWQIYTHTGNWGEEWVDIRTGQPIEDVDPRGPEYSKHIVIKDNGARISFYGYGEPSFKDFMVLPSNQESTKIFTFDLDITGISYHSMEGGGFLFNTKLVGGLLSGYCLLIQEGEGGYYDENDIWHPNNIVNLYKIDGLNADSFHESVNAYMEYDFEEITLLGTYNLAQGNLHSMRVEATPTTVEIWDGDAKLIDNYTLPAVFGNGIGLIASYAPHACEELSYFTYKNLVISGISVVWPIVDLTAIPGVGEVNLTFTAPAGATNVVLEQSTDGINYTPATVTSPITATSTSATATDLDNVLYYFRLVVTGGDFAGISNVATATPLKGPDKPVITTEPRAVDADSILIEGTNQVGTSVKVFVDGVSYDAIVEGGTFSVEVDLAQNAVNTITAKATDQSGTSGLSNKVEIIEDSIIPTIEVTGNPTELTQNPVLTINATAGLSGKTVTVSKDGGAAKVVTGNTYKLTSNGTYIFTVTNGLGISASTTVVVTKVELGGKVVDDVPHTGVSENNSLVIIMLLVYGFVVLTLTKLSILSNK